jgi:twitching motility protein PilT
LATKRNASDVHLQVGLPPVLRIHTQLAPLDSGALSAKDTERLVFSIMSEIQKKLFHERLQ